MPAIAIGVSDPTTGAQSDGYYYGGTNGNGNGFFNRWFVALKRIDFNHLIDDFLVVIIVEIKFTLEL